MNAVEVVFFLISYNFLDPVPVWLGHQGVLAVALGVSFTTFIALSSSCWGVNMGACWLWGMLAPGTCCAGQGGGASCRRGLADGLAVSGCVTRSCSGQASSPSGRRGLT